MVNDRLMKWTHKVECKWATKSQHQQDNRDNNGRFSEPCLRNAALPCPTTVYRSWELEFTRFHLTCWNTTTLRTACMVRFRTRSMLRTNRSTRMSRLRTWLTIIIWLTQFPEIVSPWPSARLPTTPSSWPTSRKSDKTILLDLVYS